VLVKRGNHNNVLNTPAAMSTWSPSVPGISTPMRHATLRCPCRQRPRRRAAGKPDEAAAADHSTFIGDEPAAQPSTFLPSRNL
jgi:hypothetical protein